MLSLNDAKLNYSFVLSLVIGAWALGFQLSAVAQPKPVTEGVGSAPPIAADSSKGPGTDIDADAPVVNKNQEPRQPTPNTAQASTPAQQNAARAPAQQNTSSPGQTGPQKPQIPTVEVAGDDDDKEGAGALPAGEELVNIDFPEPTDIRDIIKAVALWTNKNVLLDKNVQGRVQIISPKKVTKEEAYQAFLSALNLVDLTTVETGKVIKIMPVRQAVKGNLKTFLGASWTPRTDEVITQIVPLRYIEANELQRSLSRIVSPNSIIPYKPTNTLIISDSGYKVRRILDIIELLDVQGQQPKVAIVPIKHGEAKSIADKVSAIFKSSGAATGAKGGGPGSYLTYKILTDERSNSVIIFGPPRTIQDVKALVRKLDIKLDDPSNQSSIHVRPLEYAEAKKLAATLSALGQGGSSRRSTRRPPVRRNVAGSNSSETNASDVVAQLEDIKIAADESSNSLIITGNRAAYQALNSIIRKLDVRRPQVYVQSDILDIQGDNGFDANFSVFSGFPGPGESNVATTWEAGPLATLIASQTSSSTSSTQTLAAANSAFGDQFTVGILSGKSVNIPGIGEFSPGALIKLLKADANTRILASPHLLTANNEEAEVSAGQRVFIRSAGETNATGSFNPRVEKENVDLSLKIKPNVSYSNYLTLNVEIDANSIAQLDPSTGLPLVSKRKSKQIVTVKNGQTVVISGLARIDEKETFRKIPLLGDIPLLGWLFRNTKIVKVRSNLTIFLTPNIVHGAEDLAAVYRKKLAERDELLSALYGSGFKDSEFYKRLPKEEDGVYKPDPMDDYEKKRLQKIRQDILRNSGEDVDEMPEVESNIEDLPAPAGTLGDSSIGTGVGSQDLQPPSAGQPFGDEGNDDLSVGPDDLPEESPPPTD